MNSRSWLVGLFCSVCLSLAADDGAPRSLDPRLKIDLFAEHPTIVTPTGLDVDHLGRVWALESNTHFPPPGYNRHPTDRLYVMVDKNGDGRAAGSDEVVTFADGFTAAMSVAVRLRDDGGQDVYVATRMAVYRLHDKNHDGRADESEREKILWLDTAGNYPHNGLGGFAFDALGGMFVGFGENLGAKYVLNGSDGTKLEGRDAGNVYRCRPDGSQLSLWSTGFWNPHASCVDAFGRLFTVDNDPDSRPPCRLLHLVEGGDCGYRFRNGRKGLHPFTAWNGEILGTLPMVAGTGEAPSGIVAYESDGLPADYVGNLLVGSWGDHRLDRFRLKPKGCSFTSQAEPFITGGEDFRPVGLAVAPDGSLFCTDWVKKDYKLHSHGRVWRVSAVNPPQRRVLDVATIPAMKRDDLPALLDSPRLEVRRAAAKQLAKLDPSQLEQSLVSAIWQRNGGATPKPPAKPTSKRNRIEAFWALWNKTSHKPLFDNFSPSSKPASYATSGPHDEVSTAARLVVPYRLSPEDARPRPEFHLDAFDLIPLAKKLDPPDASEFHGRPLEDAGLLAASIHQYIIHERRIAAPLFDLPDPFLFNLTVQRFATDLKSDRDLTPRSLLDQKQLSPRARTGMVLAVRRRTPANAEFIRAALADPAIEVRRAAVQWAAEESLQAVRPQVAAALDAGPVTPELFLTVIAALQILDGVSPQDIDQTPASEFALKIAKDDKRSPAVRAIALRLVSPGTKGLETKLLGDLLTATDPQLRLESLRTLRSTALPGAAALLRGIAENPREPTRFRAEALIGLAPADATDGPANRKSLLALLADEDLQVVREAALTLRAPTLDDATRAALNAALQTNAARTIGPDVNFVLQGQPARHTQLAPGGDAEAGERVFFHPQAAGCFKCHTVHGRGGRIGPDLTVIAATMSREKLAQSILEPSREISPQFTNWHFELKDGRIVTGMILSEIEGRVELGNAEGNVVRFHLRDIEQSTPQKTSVMPEKLAEQLSPTQLRDLLAFLETLKP